MTIEEIVSAPVETPTDAQPQNEAQDTPDVKVEAEAEKPVAKTPEQEAAEASEAAKKLNARKQSAQERINQITRAKHDSDREVARLQARLAKYETAQAPDPAKYENQDQFDLDRQRHINATLRKEELANDVEAARERAMSETVSVFNERAEDFRLDNPTYKPSSLFISPDAQSAQAMAIEILESENGPALEHYLTQNPRLAAQISNMPQRQMVRELAKIEVALTTPAPVKVTQAPAPIKPIAGGAAKQTAPNPDNMGFAEYRKYREAGGK